MKQVFKILLNTNNLTVFSTILKQTIHIFDVIDNRFEFYYDESNECYYVIDKLLNTKTVLEIKVRKYKEFKEVKEIRRIRYWFPKSNNLDKKEYCKSVSDIKFQLFGEYKGTGGSPLSLTDDVCKNIINKSYNDFGFLLGYTDMIQSECKYQQN